MIMIMNDVFYVTLMPIFSGYWRGTRPLSLKFYRHVEQIIIILIGMWKHWIHITLLSYYMWLLVQTPAHVNWRLEHQVPQGGPSKFWRLSSFFSPFCLFFERPSSTEFYLQYTKVLFLYQSLIYFQTAYKVTSWFSI